MWGDQLDRQRAEQIRPPLQVIPIESESKGSSCPFYTENGLCTLVIDGLYDNPAGSAAMSYERSRLMMTKAQPSTGKVDRFENACFAAAVTAMDQIHPRTRCKCHLLDDPEILNPELLNSHTFVAKKKGA